MRGSRVNLLLEQEKKEKKKSPMMMKKKTLQLEREGMRQGWAQMQRATRRV